MEDFTIDTIRCIFKKNIYNIYHNIISIYNIDRFLMYYKEVIQYIESLLTLVRFNYNN